MTSQHMPMTPIYFFPERGVQDRKIYIKDLGQYFKTQCSKLALSRQLCKTKTS